MAKLFGLDFVPLSVPWERRMQTATLCLFMFCIFGLYFGGRILPFYLFGWTSYYWVVLLYLSWMWYDLDTPSRGSRIFKWWRSKRIWKPLADYFPAHLEKTVDLDPSRNYIFGSHPHGVISIGACINFITDATDFAGIFPGIQRRLCTLKGNFYTPVQRELAMAWGAMDVSKESIQHVLTKMGKGQVVIIIIGGAQEAFDATADSYQLTLLRRKGFAKMAMRCGADLVPVYTFGENHLWDVTQTAENSLVRRFQETCKTLFGFGPVFFHGRGVFNYTFGLIPHRKELTTIVGKPINVQQTDNPSQAQIDALHNAYCAALRDLFENNKKRFGISERAHLVFV